MVFEFTAAKNCPPWLKRVSLHAWGAFSTNDGWWCLFAGLPKTPTKSPYKIHPSWGPFFWRKNLPWKMCPKNPASSQVFQQFPLKQPREALDTLSSLKPQQFPSLDGNLLVSLEVLHQEIHQSHLICKAHDEVKATLEPVLNDGFCPGKELACLKGQCWGMQFCHVIHFLERHPKVGQAVFWEWYLISMIHERCPLPNKICTLPRHLDGRQRKRLPWKITKHGEGRLSPCLQKHQHKHNGCRPRWIPCTALAFDPRNSKFEPSCLGLSRWLTVVRTSTQRAYLIIKLDPAKSL